MCIYFIFRNYLCPGCEYPMCDNLCSTGPNHLRECEIISKCKPANQPPTLQIDRHSVHLWREFKLIGKFTYNKFSI